MLIAMMPEKPIGSERARNNEKPNILERAIDEEKPVEEERARDREKPMVGERVPVKRDKKGTGLGGEIYGPF